MKMRTIVVLFTLSVTASAFAQKVESLTDSGNAFARICSGIEKENKTPDDYINVNTCSAYVSGFVTGSSYGMSYAKSVMHATGQEMFCAPETVENGQVVKVMLKYLRDNPAEAHNHTGLLLLAALRKAYPCD